MLTFTMWDIYVRYLAFCALQRAAFVEYMTSRGYLERPVTYGAVLFTEPEWILAGGK